jgi:hypothetical protein
VSVKRWCRERLARGEALCTLPARVRVTSRHGTPDERSRELCVVHARRWRAQLASTPGAFPLGWMRINPHETREQERDRMAAQKTPG